MSSRFLWVSVAGDHAPSEWWNEQCGACRLEWHLTDDPTSMARKVRRMMGNAAMDSRGWLGLSTVLSSVTQTLCIDLSAWPVAQFNREMRECIENTNIQIIWIAEIGLADWLDSFSDNWIMSWAIIPRKSSSSPLDTWSGGQAGIKQFANAHWNQLKNYEPGDYRSLAPELVRSLSRNGPGIQLRDTIFDQIWSELDAKHQKIAIKATTDSYIAVQPDDPLVRLGLVVRNELANYEWSSPLFSAYVHAYHVQRMGTQAQDEREDLPTSKKEVFKSIYVQLRKRWTGLAGGVNKLWTAFIKEVDDRQMVLGKVVIIASLISLVLLYLGHPVISFLIVVIALPTTLTSLGIELHKNNNLPKMIDASNAKRFVILSKRSRWMAISVFAGMLASFVFFLSPQQIEIYNPKSSLSLFVTYPRWLTSGDSHWFAFSLACFESQCPTQELTIDTDAEVVFTQTQGSRWAGIIEARQPSMKVEFAVADAPDFGRPISEAAQSARNVWYFSCRPEPPRPRYYQVNLSAVDPSLAEQDELTYKLWIDVLPRSIPCIGAFLDTPENLGPPRQWHKFIEEHEFLRESESTSAKLVQWLSNRKVVRWD